MKASCFPLAVLLVVSGIALADVGEAPSQAAPAIVPLASASA